MKRLILLLYSVLLLVVCSCTERKYVTVDDFHLDFSVDTVHFDTVFTTIGTSTREFRVVNNNNRWIKIDQISIAGQNPSFRLNIDGHSSNTSSDIEIAPGDSIFIFVDAIIDPNNSNSPIAINDSIIFSYYDRIQYVNLLAWGQDINLIQGEEISTETWSDDKPYVIYNSMIVDTGEVLTIMAGVRVLFHSGSTMYIAGTLITEGTIEERVVFSSDRIEEVYDDIPGQWKGLYFLNGSTNNRIENTDISNAVSALHLGNLRSLDDPPDLTISNSRIVHNSVTGISSLGATISAANCVVTHNGFYSLYLAMGGSYDFLHCSINSYWDYSIRTVPGILISDYVDYNDTIYSGVLDHIIFSNTSLTGGLVNELGIYSYLDETLNCQFSNCLITINEELDIWNNYDFSSSIISSEPGYISTYEYDLRPDTLSILLDNADSDLSISVSSDIRGFSRLADTGPDIGAYERQIGETSKK